MSSGPIRKKSKQNLQYKSRLEPAVPTKLDLSNSVRASAVSETPKVLSTTRETKIPARQRRVYDLSKGFLASLVFTKVPWPATTEAELDLCDAAWVEATHSLTLVKRALGGLQSNDYVYNLPDGPSQEIDPVSRSLVSSPTTPSKCN